MFWSFLGAESSVKSFDDFAALLDLTFLISRPIAQHHHLLHNLNGRRTW